MSWADLLAMALGAFLWFVALAWYLYEAVRAQTWTDPKGGRK